MRRKTGTTARSVRPLALMLVLGAALLACALVGRPASASGETGASPNGSEPGMTSCPASNPPNQMTLVAGTPQTTTLDTAFGTGLQVALTNSDGCAATGVAGVAVTFSAPASGASGVFSGSGSSSVSVGSDSSGAVSAPAFTANGIAGGYTVTAISRYGSVSFSLNNTAAGIPAAITAVSPASMSARVARRYAQPLAVTVLDANGNPVAGATVTFTLDTASASSCGTSASASASFTGGSTQATATSNASGVASSPSFTANGASGSFTATAAISSSSANPNSGTGAEPDAPKTPAGNATALSFALENLTGNPVKLTPGVGSTQSTGAGTRFPIRLAVTVTDAQKNPVPDALVAFSAPTDGPSGRFTIHSRGRHHHLRTSRRRVVDVKTDSCGIAVAPAFTADDRPGGYIVKATVKHAKPAVFAMLNTRRRAA